MRSSRAGREGRSPVGADAHIARSCSGTIRALSRNPKAACKSPFFCQPLTRDSLLLKLLNGRDTVLRNRRSVRRQARRNTTLAWLRIRTEFIDIALAGVYGFPQVVSGRLSLQCHFVQIVCTSRTYLVLMCLHAMQDAAISGRDRTTIFLDVLTAGGLQFLYTCRQPLEYRIHHVRLRICDARNGEAQGEERNLSQEAERAFH